MCAATKRPFNLYTLGRKIYCLAEKKQRARDSPRAVFAKCQRDSASRKYSHQFSVCIKAHAAQYVLSHRGTAPSTVYTSEPQLEAHRQKLGFNFGYLFEHLFTKVCDAAAVADFVIRGNTMCVYVSTWITVTLMLMLMLYALYMRRTPPGCIPFARARG